MNHKTANSHRVRFRGDNMFVFIDPELREVFISRIEKPEETENDTIGSSIDTITRLTSKLWNEHKCLDTIVDQLNKASRKPHDIPGILAVLLEDYKE